MAQIDALTVVFIRASNYDDDGFLVRYLRGVLPSNTLSCMRSLTLDFADKWRVERGIDIRVEVYDEIVDTVPFKRLARMNRGSRKVIAALVGVQSNQYPRAADIAVRLSGLGVKTLIGGFHVSGVMAMFGEPTPELTAAMEQGVTLVQGEAENCWEDILSDCVAGVGRTLYRVTEYPDISRMPVPRPAPDYMKKFALPNMGTIDCSRGCPFNCSFCTIINVQGRKMRCRSAEHVLATIRENYARKINQYFFTDDNFSRNPAWEAILDGFIRLREEEGLDKLSFMMQVDTACHRIPNFVRKAGRANCTQVFIGMESVNPKNLEAAGKRQNKVDDYADYVAAWHAAGVMTHVGYIIGFPFDTLESVRRDIDTLKNDIKVDQASFFILTPLPGSRDHHDLVESGAAVDPDLNKYDAFHVLTEHPRMTGDEWVRAYNGAWESFCEFDNLKRILLRAGQKAYWNIFKNIMWYKNSLLEPRHPMVAGFCRIRRRKEIQPGTPVMGLVPFLAMRFREIRRGIEKRIGLFFELQELWWLTRKPDDPTFQLVADFTATIGGIHRRIAALDLNGSYARWTEDLTAAAASLPVKFRSLAATGALKEKARARIGRLIDDVSVNLEALRSGDAYRRSVSLVTQCMADLSRQVEESSLKHVKARRSVTHFWVITWHRLKRRRFLSFAASTPRIIVSACRDIHMSLIFTAHILHHAR